MRTRKAIVRSVSLAFLWLVFGMMSCTGLRDLQLTKSVSSSNQTGKTEAEEKVDSVLVCIEVEYPDGEVGFGSGFLVSNEGHLVTANHVVQGASRIIVELAHRKGAFEAESLEYVPDKDVALLRISAAPGDLPDVPAFTYVYPTSQRLEKARVMGIFRCTPKADRSGIRCNRITGVNDTAIFVDLGTLDKGSSGSPIIIENLGHIVGFVKSGFALRVYGPQTNELDTVWVGPHSLVPADFFLDLLTRYQVPVNTISVRSLVRQLPVEAPAPPPKKVATEELMGMLNMVEFVVENTIKDLELIFRRKLFIDIVFETSLELASLRKVLMSYEGRLSESRKRAIFLYLQGLLVKATHAGGARESSKYFVLANQEDPSFAEPHYQIGIYLIKHSDRRKEAYDHLLAAKQYDRENPEVLRSLAVYYLETEQLDSAEVYLKEAESRLPGDPRVVHYWGVFYDPYWRSKMNPKADAEKSKLYFLRCIYLAPNYTRAINNLAWLQIKQLETGVSQNDDKIDEIKSSLRINLERLARFVGWGITDPRVINTLSKGYTVLGDHTTACGYLKLTEEHMVGFNLSPEYLRELKAENSEIREECGCKP